MIVFEKLIGCVTLPFFIASIIVFLILIFSKKKESLFLFFILLFPLLWRIVAKNQLTSSRYCSIFLVFFIVYAIYALKSCAFLKNKKIVWIIAVLSLVVSNLVLAYYPFRNNYIYDLQEEISLLSDHKKNIFFVENKDLKRLTTSNAKVYGRDARPETDKDFEELLNTFEYWSKNAFYLFPEKKDAAPRIISTDIFNNKITLKKTAQFFTNKNKTKIYSTYCHLHFYPQSYDFLKKANSDLIQSILYNGILKSFNLEKDVYIYQIKDKLYWIIGAEMEKKTEIIYQVYSDRTDLLPEIERKYGFENLYFFVGSKYELLRYGKYYIMERSIPSNYPITHVNVGLNPPNEKVTYFRRFSITDY